MSEYVLANGGDRDLYDFLCDHTMYGSWFAGVSSREMDEYDVKMFQEFCWESWEKEIEGYSVNPKHTQKFIGKMLLYGAKYKESRGIEKA